jgi:hypothetical protein
VTLAQGSPPERELFSILFLKVAICERNGKSGGASIEQYIARLQRRCSYEMAAA